MRIFRTPLLLCVLFIAVFRGPASADEVLQWVDDEHWDVSAHVGPFLPFELPGVTEILPFWGVSLSHPTSVIRVEYSFLSGRSKGVTYMNPSISIRADFTVAQFVEGFLKLGADFHYYQPVYADGSPASYRQNGGGHLGFGGFIPISKGLAFRTEAKLNRGAGFSVYVGVGLIAEI